MHKPFFSEKPSYRTARFAEMLKEELSLMIPGDLDDPTFKDTPFLTITKVDVMPDLRNANIWFSSTELDPENALHEKKIQKLEHALNHAAGYLRHQLMQSMNTKVTPALHFRFDRGYSNTMRINSLLGEI